MEIYDSKSGRSFHLFFDDVSEKRAAQIIVDVLINGIPEERVVSKVPDFLNTCI